MKDPPNFDSNEYAHSIPVDELPLHASLRQSDFDTREIAANVELNLRDHHQVHEQRQATLDQLRERGEIAAERYPIEDIHELHQYCIPITLLHLRHQLRLPQAVEIYPEELLKLGYFVFVGSDGRCHCLAGKECVKEKIILLPTDFGDVDNETATLMGEEFFT